MVSMMPMVPMVFVMAVMAVVPIMTRPRPTTTVITPPIMRRPTPAPQEPRGTPEQSAATTPMPTTISIGAPLVTGLSVMARMPVLLAVTPLELILDDVRRNSTHGAAQQRAELPLAELVPYKPAGAASQQCRAETSFPIRLAAIRIAIVRGSSRVRVGGVRARQRRC